MRNKYRMIDTPRGQAFARVAKLRTSAKRTKPKHNAKRIIREARDTQFWGPTVKSKLEKRCNARTIADRGLLPSYYLREQPSDLPRRLTGLTTIDDIPATKLAQLERWSGKAVSVI